MWEVNYNSVIERAKKNNTLSVLNHYNIVKNMIIDILGSDSSGGHLRDDEDDKGPRKRVRVK